jgi:hypothetical protein
LRDCALSMPDGTISKIKSKNRNMKDSLNPAVVQLDFHNHDNYAGR